MKKDWEIKKLVDVCNLITCGVAKRPEYVDDGIPFLSAKNVKKGTVLWNNYKYISQETHNELTKNNKPLKGDILYTRVGSFGEAAVIEEDKEFSVFVSLTLIKSKKEILNEYFLKYFLNSEAVKTLAKNSISGSGVGNLNVGTVREFEISLPPLKEQQQIVAILDKAFTAIDTAKANAQQNLLNAKQLFESYLQNIFENKGDDWVEKSLGDVCSLYQGLAINRKTKHYLVEKSNLPLLRIKDLRNNTAEKYVDEENYPANALVNKEDIIYTRTGNSLGLVFRGRYGVLHNNSFKIIPTEILSNDYLFIWLQNPLFKSKIFGLAFKAAQPDITHKIFKLQKIKIPPLKEQQQIVKKLNNLSAETKKLEVIYQQKIDDLEELKKSVLQKAFNGELTASSIKTTVNNTIAVIPNISTTDLHAGIIAIALQSHIEKNKENTFHHVKSEKIIHLAETFVGIHLNRNPVKDAAGPNDFPLAKKVESRARKAGFFTVRKQNGRYMYNQGSQFNKLIAKVKLVLNEKTEPLMNLLDLMVPMTTQQAEILATVYASWNNLIIENKTINHEAIVSEARENWHIEKMNIPREKFFKAITWMKSKGVIPTGIGKTVISKKK